MYDRTICLHRQSLCKT